MAETKHEFVDDNPYITYTGKTDTAYDGEGGGGGGGGYTLPIASADTLGGVKIGDGLEIAESGVLSVDVENPYFKVTATYGNSAMTLDKSYNQIKEAIDSGKIPYLYFDDSPSISYCCPFVGIGFIGTDYTASFILAGQLEVMVFTNASPDQNLAWLD